MIICTNNLKRCKIITPVHCSKITFLFSAKTCPVVEQIIQFSSSQLLWTGRRTWIYTLINTYIYIHYFPIHIQINIRSEVEIRETHELGSDVPCLFIVKQRIFAGIYWFKMLSLYIQKFFEYKNFKSTMSVCFLTCSHPLKGVFDIRLSECIH